MRDRWSLLDSDIWGELDPDLWGPPQVPEVGIEAQPSGVLPGQEPFSARKPYLGATTPPPAQGSSKPYLDSPDSFVKMMTAPVRHLKDIIEKESAFEKPYMHGTEGYPQMHVDLPNPDWGSYHVPGFSIPVLTGKTDTGSGCKYCIIICYGSVEADCDENYGWCHLSIACTHDTSGECRDCRWDIEGPPYRLEKDSIDGWDIYPEWGGIPAGDDGYKTATYVVTMTDGLGHVCADTFDLSCAPCQNPDCTITGPTTAVQPSSVQYSVADQFGCDVEWSVSGGGNVSINNAGLVTVGAGACGTFTVTASISGNQNNCSESKPVRITNNGKWHVDGCPTNAGDDADMCSFSCPGYVISNYYICDLSYPANCDHGSSHPCATKVDADTGYGYADIATYCWDTTDPSCTLNNICHYTDYDLNCETYNRTQSALHALKFTWECP